MSILIQLSKEIEADCTFKKNKQEFLLPILPFSFINSISIVDKRTENEISLIENSIIISKKSVRYLLYKVRYTNC